MSLSSSPGSRAEYAHIGTANRCVLPPPCCIAAAQCRRLRRGDHALLTSRCAFPAQPVARSPSSATFGAVSSSASSAVRKPGNVRKRRPAGLSRRGASTLTARPHRRDEVAAASRAIVVPEHISQSSTTSWIAAPPIQLWRLPLGATSSNCFRSPHL